MGIHLCQAQFQLIGAATTNSTPNCFTITPDQNWQSGAVWYTQRVDINKVFDVYTKIYMGNKDSGADGLAFVLQQVSTNVGVVGGGIGYEGLRPSLAVEFDTYQNGDYSDP